MYNEKMNEQYNKFVEGWSLRLIDRYSIIPSRNDEIDFELSDFELIKYREDICKRSGLEPYFFIADDIRENYMTGDDIVFGLRVTPSQLNMLVNDVAKRVYEMCRSDIAQEDRFEREINNVVNKYFEKYKMDTLDEMYEKKDLYKKLCKEHGDETGREKFIEVRAKKWDKLLKKDRKAITYDIVLSGLYDEESSENKELAEKIMPSISKMIATFERDNLEGGLIKRDLRNAAFYGEDR